MLRRRRTTRAGSLGTDTELQDLRRRVESATWLLNHEPFLHVERYDDDWPGPVGASVVVGLHEIAGHDFPDLLEGTVLMLLQRSDVDDVLNEDAEVIHVWSTGLDTGGLMILLQEWWHAHLKAIVDQSPPGPAG